MAVPLIAPVLRYILFGAATAIGWKVGSYAFETFLEKRCFSKLGDDPANQASCAPASDPVK